MSTRGNSIVKLYNSVHEREAFETLADLFSIFIAAENLEKSFIKDTVSHDEYSSACLKLIGQYRTIVRSLGTEFDIRKFLTTYEVQCPAAIHRLVEVGVPATTEHTTNSEGNLTKHVAETVQYFITLLDALKLNLFSVDQIHPLVTDLMRSLSQIKKLPSSYEGKGRILEWLKKLNRMKANDELSPEDARQLSFDLEMSLSEFHSTLASL